MLSPGREISPGPQLIQRDPHSFQVELMQISIARFFLLGSGQWQCVICRKLNGSEGEYIAPSKEDLRYFPELASPVLITFKLETRDLVSFIPVSDSRMSAPIVLS